MCYVFSFISCGILARAVTTSGKNVNDQDFQTERNILQLQVYQTTLLILTIFLGEKDPMHQQLKKNE